MEEELLLPPAVGPTLFMSPFFLWRRYCQNRLVLHDERMLGPRATMASIYRMFDTNDAQSISG